MNIFIPDSWIKEHLETQATTKEIAKYLSLCSQSVEKISRIGKDEVYEIEITTNRPDCLSVYGIARELAAILPCFGIKTSLKPLNLKGIPKPEKSFPLEVKIGVPGLCPRFTALIFDQVKVKPSPKIVSQRLEKSGIRSLNNVVDISNYLMLELGQPMHTFDYDKIKKGKMILREAKNGEKIITLDNQSRQLPEGAIIIEDGEGRIIDLCGIMGGKNSEVDQTTKRVLLFVQTYDPAKIRLTCQTLAFRTEAAQRFEKGVNPEGVIPAMKKAVDMFKKSTEAKVASPLIDIYPNPALPQKVNLYLNKLNQLMGVNLKIEAVKKILESLGFATKVKIKNSALQVSVPHWRQGDITIPEDLVEEVARIYGYENLPSILPQRETPFLTEEATFFWEEEIKNALKYWGFSETFNYSMTSAKLLQKTGFKAEKCLKIANPLSDDLEVMRPSLIPSLLEVVGKNQNAKLRLFELANIYLPSGSHRLPEEKLKLTGVITGDSFYQAKGIIESILEELEIKQYVFKTYPNPEKLFHPFRSSQLFNKNCLIGILAEINQLILAKLGIKGKAVAFELDFDRLVKFSTTQKIYQPLAKYPAIIEDFAFVVPEKTLIGPMIQLIKSVDSIIQTVELIDSYDQTRTFRITFQSFKKTLNDQEVKKIRNKIINKIESKFKASLKSKK